MFQEVSISFRPLACQLRTSQSHRPLTLGTPLLNFKSPCFPMPAPNNNKKKNKQKRNLHKTCAVLNASIALLIWGRNPWTSMNYALKSAISLLTFQRSITLRSHSWMQTVWLPELSNVVTCPVLTLELGVLVKRGALILGMTTDWNTTSINKLPVMDMQMEQGQILK